MIILKNPWGYTNASMYSYRRYYDGNNIIVEVTLPGTEKKDIKLRYRPDSQSLCIFVKEREEQEIPIYKEIDPDNVTAKLELGVLKITLPFRHTDKEIKIE